MSFWIRLHFSFFQNSRVTAPPFLAPTRLEVLAPLRSLERQIKLELSSTFSQREKGCFKVVWLQVKKNINKDILRHSWEMVSCNRVITQTHFRFLSQLYYSGLDYKHWSISVILINFLISCKIFSGVGKAVITVKEEYLASNLNYNITRTRKLRKSATKKNADQESFSANSITSVHSLLHFTRTRSWKAWTKMMYFVFLKATDRNLHFMDGLTLSLFASAAQTLMHPFIAQITRPIKYILI